MRRRELVDAEHFLSAERELIDRGASHRAEAEDYDIKQLVPYSPYGIQMFFTCVA